MRFAPAVFWRPLPDESGSGVSVVAESSVPSIVPPATEHGSHSTLSHPETGRARTLPVAELAPASEPVATMYRIASLDGRGRVSDLAVIQALGWSRRQRVEMSISMGAILVRDHPDGTWRLTGQGHVRVPSPIRHWCDLNPGDRVLLAADPARDVLIVHTMADLDALLTARHTALLAGDDG